MDGGHLAEPEPLPRRGPVPVVVGAAALWAFGFAAASVYVALGGQAGAQLVAPALTERALARDPAMTGVLWATGALKAALGLAILVGPVLAGRRVRRWASYGFQALGVMLALWGIAEGGAGLLVLTDRIPPLDGWGDGSVARFYAAVWGPWWLAGGVLYVLAGRTLLSDLRGQRWVEKRSATSPSSSGQES